MSKQNQTVTEKTHSLTDAQIEAMVAEKVEAMKKAREPQHYKFDMLASAANVSVKHRPDDDALVIVVRGVSAALNALRINPKGAPRIYDFRGHAAQDRTDKDGNPLDNPIEGLRIGAPQLNNPMPLGMVLTLYGEPGTSGRKKLLSAAKAQNITWDEPENKKAAKADIWEG